MAGGAVTTPGFDDYGAYQGTQVIYDMPARAYHSDADGPRLSQSLATLCVQKSPLHAWQAHPLLGNTPWSYQASPDDGSLMHSLMLEPDSNDIEEIDAGSVLTKDGKPAKSPLATIEGKKLVEDALAAGRIPILKDKLDAYKYKARALTQRLENHPTTPVVFDGKSEVVIYWTEETPSGPVRCRCRIDHLTGFDGGSALRIIDLKTCDSAAVRDVRAVSWRLGYDIQAAAYTRAVAAAYPAFAGRIEVVFAFCELDKPYACNPVSLSGEFLRLGEQRWERGRDMWSKCLNEDNWATYGGGKLEPPAWASAEELGE